MRVIRISAYIVVTLILIAAIFSWFFSQSLKPNYEGARDLPDLQDKVEVFFDEWGIPHIYGSSDADVYYALGYIHAQDRLFQMDVLRRIGGGRLAEFFGESVSGS